MVFVRWLHGLRWYDQKISIFLLYLLKVKSPQVLVLYKCHLLKNMHLNNFFSFSSFMGPQIGIFPQDGPYGVSLIPDLGYLDNEIWLLCLVAKAKIWDF